MSARPDVEVLLAAVTPCGTGLPARAWQCLTADEHQRAERFRHNADRVRFVAARYLLLTSLRHRFGVGDLRLVTPQGAKPYVAGTGLPAGLDVNISHAAGLVGCVVGLGAAVGIDIEHVGRVADAGAITRAHFAPEEQAYGGDPATFLRMWTLKEAVVKAVGLGLRLKLSAFACEAEPPRLIRSTQALGSVTAWRLESWADTSHIVALAVRDGARQAVHPRHVDLAVF